MKTIPHKGSMFTELISDRTSLTVDIETTSVRGTDSLPAHLRLISIAVVVAQNGTRRKDYHWLVNPGVPVDSDSSAYNGITTDDIAEAGTPQQVLARFTRVLAQYPDADLVCHNAGFDIGVLREEYRRAGAAIPERTVYDTMRIGARIGVDEIPKRPKLTALVERYAISNNLGGKDARLRKALKDARDTADIFIWLLAEAAERDIAIWDQFVTAAQPTTTTDVAPSFPGRLHKLLLPTIPVDHYRDVHGHFLHDPPTEDEVAEWIAEVAGCVSLRCAYIAEKVTLEAVHTELLLPRLTLLLDDCDRPGMVATLLGGIRPMLETLDKPTARSWWETSNARIKAAPRCVNASACPSCVNEHACPLDVTYQLVTERAVGYGRDRLTSRASRDDLFKPGRWRKIDTWPRKGMPEIAAYTMWLVVGEYARENNTTRAREMLNECVARDLHLVEPRLALEVARYWAEQRRSEDVNMLVEAVLASATTDRAFVEFDMWFHDSFMPTVAAASNGASEAKPKPRKLKRIPSPVELRPNDRTHQYRYRVYA